jgi:hypothetical protein
VRIDIEDVFALRKEMKRINSMPLCEIEWFENGKPIVVSQEKLDEFLFTGLSNMDFILTDAYRDYIEEDYTVREVYGDNREPVTDSDEFVFINFCEVFFTIGVERQSLIFVPKVGDRVRLYSVETSKVGEFELKKIGLCTGAWDQIIYEKDTAKKG